VENNTANHILKGLLGIIHAAMLDPGVWEITPNEERAKVAQ
jgi:hypothetical protein